MDKQYVVYSRVLLNSKKGRNWHRPQHGWTLKIWCQVVSGNGWQGYTAMWMCLKSLSLAQFGHSVISDSLWPHGLQHTRPPCPPPTLGVYSNSCSLSWWCHPTISFSVVPFSSCPQSSPSIRVFSNESVLRITWPKYWSFSWAVHLKMLKRVNPMLCIFYHNLKKCNAQTENQENYRR